MNAAHLLGVEETLVPVSLLPTVVLVLPKTLTQKVHTEISFHGSMLNSTYIIYETTLTNFSNKLLKEADSFSETVLVECSPDTPGCPALPKSPHQLTTDGNICCDVNLANNLERKLCIILGPNFSRITCQCKKSCSKQANFISPSCRIKRMLEPLVSVYYCISILISHATFYVSVTMRISRRM
ncbi:hypothetical protein GOODEAATRI_030135 [Goodea atripinnis]|uniref:Uncharacterized protein n=1 Tax=Goodea atripinnis TaxID=208336 RepID=A0ABV0NZ31_9TELE